MANNEQQPDEGPRSFSRFIEQVDEGLCHIEVSKALHSLAAKLSEHSGPAKNKAKGKLSLALDITVEGDVVAVTWDVKVKEPTPKRSTAIFWLTKGKNLSPENQRQQKLPLRDVNTKENEAKDINDPTPVTAAREV